MLTPKPTGHQQENHLIDGSKKWKKVGRVAPGELSALRDDVPGPLWVNGGRNNDRVSVADAHNLDNSLLLIKPANLGIVVQWKNKGMQVRASFHHNENNYDMAVTDPVAEEKYTQMAKADYRRDNTNTLPREYETPDGVYLCVSLAEQTFYGKLYKLVAAIIGDRLMLDELFTTVIPRMLRRFCRAVETTRCERRVRCPLTPIQPLQPAIQSRGNRG